MMKEQLCAAFCKGLQVHDVPVGLAVSTAFAWPDGDRVGFYVVRDPATGLHKIEDSGLTLTFLQAAGFNTRTATRERALSNLLAEHQVSYDADESIFCIDDIAETDVPLAALRFVAFLLRARDLFLLSESRVEKTFREDFAKRLEERLNQFAQIDRQKPIADDLQEFVPDFVVRAPEREPVGIYLGTSESRLLQAIIVHTRAMYVLRRPRVIVAVLQSDKGISREIRQQASTTLNALAYFRGSTADETIERIAYEATGQIPAAQIH